jgi:hypothetical protein
LMEGGVFAVKPPDSPFVCIKQTKTKQFFSKAKTFSTVFHCKCCQICFEKWWTTFWHQDFSQIELESVDKKRVSQILIDKKTASEILIGNKWRGKIQKGSQVGQFSGDITPFITTSL